MTITMSHTHTRIEINNDFSTAIKAGNSQFLCDVASAEHAARYVKRIPIKLTTINVVNSIKLDTMNFFLVDWNSLPGAIPLL